MTPGNRVAILATALMIFSYHGMGQVKTTLSEVESIEQTYQRCLDEGTNMLGCSIQYYDSVDSCLSDAYHSLLEKLKDPQKTILQQEQSTWLRKRNSKFQLIDQGNRMEGRDGQMIRQSEKADFVKARALELIGRIND